MLIGAVVGLSLVVTAAVNENAITPFGTVAPLQMSLQQKNAVLRAAVTSATECIADAVVADPRFEAFMQNGDIRELIVDSMTPCRQPVRALIDTYDRLFGEGEGESFFLGPYLDVLPTSLMSRLKDGTK